MKWVKDCLVLREGGNAVDAVKSITGGSGEVLKVGKGLLGI